MNRIKEINRGFNYIETSIRKLEKETLSKSGLNITRRELIYIVIFNDHEGKTQSEIAQASGVTKATISNQLKLLVKKDFVCLETKGGDLRNKKIRLTTLGRKALSVHDKIRAKIKKEYSEVLTETEIQTLIKIGRKILSHIKGENDDEKTL